MGRPDTRNVTKRWVQTLLLGLVILALIVVAIVNERWVTQVNLALPGEGFYWSVSQYQIAHHRLKQELRAIAAGEAANKAELSRWAAVVASRSSILAEPSEVRTVLLQVPGYLPAVRQLSVLQEGIGPLFDRTPFTQADARAVLTQMDAMGDDELLGRLSSEGRLADIGVREATLRELTWRLRWLWGALAMCLLVLVLWLLYAVRARRRYVAVAFQRELALDAMDRALIAKRKFLSMVNHEVRSPLQNIVAATEVLAVMERQPKGAAAVRRIQHAVAVLQGQLRDLLTIAKSDETALTTEEEVFDLVELVRNICADLSETAVAKGLAFSLVPTERPLVVASDPVRITQVLRNLIENAVRYTSVGRVEVVIRDSMTTQAVDAALHTESSHAVHIAIQDSGPGLPPDALKNLQGSASLFKPDHNGSGIGLLVVRDVLHQLGGRLTVSETGAAGTTLLVSLPVRLISSPTEEPALDGKLNILVVNDREDILTALTDIVRILGHACTAASNTADALDLLAAVSYDVVLIDLLMPGGMDGQTLARTVRQRAGLNATSMLILISAAENRAVGNAWPFDGFLQKPIDSNALSRLIGSRMPM